MKKLEKKIRSLEIFNAIEDYLPSDHSNRQSIDAYAQALYKQPTISPKVLDLGCGEGNSIDFFKSISEEVDWHGVDIEGSPEVKKRAREHDSIKSFDGVNLPYQDGTIDLIFCNQVMEHVRYPDALVKEAFRVLKPDGLFVGAVSYLEPHHSYSIFNFTPYGVVRVFTDAGFMLEEIRPGADALYFINRQLLNRSKILRIIWNKNYLHGFLGLIGSLFRLGHQERNFLKVQFAGHLVFQARRPVSDNQLEWNSDI